MTDADRVTADGNPLLLTMEGEFVVKNRVLFTGALTIARKTPRGRRSRPPSVCKESTDGQETGTRT
jgi:hypothetical protein